MNQQNTTSLSDTQIAALTAYLEANPLVDTCSVGYSEEAPRTVCAPKEAIDKDRRTYVATLGDSTGNINLDFGDTLPLD